MRSMRATLEKDDGWVQLDTCLGLFHGLCSGKEAFTVALAEVLASGTVLSCKETVKPWQPSVTNLPITLTVKSFAFAQIWIQELGYRAGMCRGFELVLFYGCFLGFMA